VTPPYRIVFMGTPDFAVPTLEALHESEHEVVLVVTQPDRRKGRGRKLAAAPVKRVAEHHQYPVFQPASVKNGAALKRIEAARPDFLVVIAFGHVLPPAILDIPKFGAINCHASLLPKYRGPAPIHWAIINGEAETGITTMMMNKGLDTGDILMVATEPIGPEDTAGRLHDRLAVIGADLLVATLRGFAESTLEPVEQDADLATYAPLLRKSDGRINWRKPAVAIENFIRGVTPWPGAFTFHGGKRIKIFKSRPIDTRTAQQPGTVLESFPDELWIATGDGTLSIQELQGASGKRLAVEDFLRGYSLSPGEQLH
jgi:methionyl-tRNA formyltransferase